MQRINANLDFNFWEPQFKKKITESDLGDDPAHDLAHFQRVVKTAQSLAIHEGAQLAVVIPAAWLHDLVQVPKNDPRRSFASTLSAQAAIQFLSDIEYPCQFFQEIEHAIQAHSFSAKIETRSLEAQIVQDADRLDALGSIGIARCFSVGGLLKRPIYHALDPFADTRNLDDSQYTLDHFYVKLLKLVDSLQTTRGKIEGQRRLNSMKLFLEQLKYEIES